MQVFTPLLFLPGPMFAATPAGVPISKDTQLNVGLGVGAGATATGENKLLCRYLVTHIYAFMQTCIHIHVRTNIHSCMYTYVHIYTKTYIHT